MKTHIFKVDINNIDNNVIVKAAEIIKSGGLVAFPTETVYGLGGDGLNPNAAKKIYSAKGRPSDNPLILHISDIGQLSPLVREIPENALKLAKEFWPGPLTMIFKKSDIVPNETSGGLDTVAVRFPVNKVAQALITASGTPIAAPSANTSGRPSPTRASHVEYDLNGKIDMIIDGGACKFGLESTIIDVTGNIPCLLRPGSITLEMLRSVLGEVNVDKAVVSKLDKGELPKAPGMKYKHYSPSADVVIVRGDRNKMVDKINELISQTDKGLKVGVIATEENKERYINCEVLVAGSIKEPETIAANLFKMLRKCDHHHIDRVFAEGLCEDELGLAIMNRLKKAAGYCIIEV
ncbi:MAG: L-threonylcarbamoyladenylate synthase [Clostridia bacterium]|nr:L-threonylcarbamoyladenylate synthase [Clostridia bacterium]